MSGLLISHLVYGNEKEVNNLIFKPQPTNFEEHYTLLITGTDFGGEMTFRISDKKITEITVSTGLSRRETIDVFSYPEEKDWVYTFLERNFAWDSENQHFNSNLTSRVNINRHYFSGNNLIKTVCLLGNKSDINIKDILASRVLFLTLARQRKTSIDVEFLKEGYPEWCKEISSSKQTK